MRGGYLKYCSLELCPKYLPLNQKIIITTKLNMGFPSVLNLVTLTNLQCPYPQHQRAGVITQS